MVRFDYRGHGQSEGQFEACTISDWLADATDVMDAFTVGPQVSSCMQDVSDISAGLHLNVYCM